MPGILLLGDIGWRARDGRAGGYQQRFRDICYCLWSPGRDRDRGAPGPRSARGEGQGSTKIPPGARGYLSGDAGLVSPRGTRGPRPSLELLWRDTASPDISPAVAGPPKTQKISSGSCSQSWGPRGERGPPAAAAARRIRVLTCLRSRPRPAQPPHGPQPVRGPSAPFCPLRPRPAPGRWHPRPRRNLGAAFLNSREPSLLGFSVAGPVRLGPDVIRTTAGSSLLSSTPARLPRPPTPCEFPMALEQWTWQSLLPSFINLTSLTFSVFKAGSKAGPWESPQCGAILVLSDRVFLSTYQCNAKSESQCKAKKKWKEVWR